ncbi:unnamed protein product, partial [Vitis vinifera]
MYSLEICDCSFYRSPNKVGLPTTLKSLSISDCTKLDLLLPELFRCHHPVLENLSINGEYCPELLLHREGLPSNLRKLEIRGCNQLTSQMDLDLQRLTSLTHFTINGGCEGVELFPKECLLPSSLTHLSIWGLPNLKSLDNKGLQQLTSLRELWIENCPELQFSTGSTARLPLSSGRLRLSSTGTTAPIRERARMALYISHSKNRDQLGAILMGVAVHQHMGRKFLMTFAA